MTTKLMNFLRTILFDLKFFRELSDVWRNCSAPTSFLVMLTSMRFLKTDAKPSQSVKVVRVGDVSHYSCIPNFSIYLLSSQYCVCLCFMATQKRLQSSDKWWMGCFVLFPVFLFSCISNSSLIHILIPDSWICMFAILKLANPFFARNL